MVVTQRLQFRQSQSLAMTPQLQQAIKLLQLSNLELNDYLESELEQNPLLEREGPAAGGDRDALEAGAGTGGEDEVPGADDEAGSPPDSPPTNTPSMVARP